MTTFNDFWKEKAQKRRKSWAAKAKRFAEQHTQLEDIRKEVYLPLDYGINFDFEDYKLFHFIKSNPLVCWQNMNFRFSEEGLRAALEAEGADMNSFRMSVSQQPIKGLEVPQLENVWEAYRFMKPNKVYDYDKKICSWLQRMYEICTDVETVRLSYRQITMIIKRYSTEGMPFGYYELNPCEQLTKSAMLMQETDFYTLNVATLLMEAAAEWELRQEELNYYAKKLKIRTMEAATTESIEFELWDDKKLEKKVAEYIDKDYPVEKIIEQVLRPWKQTITKFFHAITEQELQNATEKFDAYSLRSDFPYYVKNVLKPYFDKQGLQAVKMWRPNEKSEVLYMENQGCLAKFVPWDDVFYPNAHYSMCVIYGKLNETPLLALAYYLQKMPEINRKTEEVVIKVIHIYDELMQQKNEKYCKNVEYLESLAAQHEGTPVGKMMKFLRWNAGRFINPKPKGYSDFSISTIKVGGETSFSFVEKDVPQGLSVVNGQLTGTYQDEVRERWLDADCQNVYVADPNTTDFDEWVKTHRRWSWSVQDFLSGYSPRDSKPSLSIDFIEQQL
jgi:hypothetical protein